MRHQKNRKHELLPLFEKFIIESAKGRRLQPNGKKISDGTIKNYENTKKLLERFCSEKKFDLRIRQERYLNTRETESEKNYWKKFYNNRNFCITILIALIIMSVKISKILKPFLII